MTRWLSALAVCLFVLVTGCANRNPYFSVVLLDSVSPELEGSVRGAASDWEALVPGLTLVVSREHEWERGRDHTFWVSQVGELAPPYIGWTNHEGSPDAAQIDIVSTPSNAWTARHELGHAMGLRHEWCGVMVANYTPGRVATTVQGCDAEQFERRSSY